MCTATGPRTGWRARPGGRVVADSGEGSTTRTGAVRAARAFRERLAHVLIPLRLVIYLLDEQLPLGRFGYHLTVRGRAPPGGSAA